MKKLIPYIQKGNMNFLSRFSLFLIPLLILLALQMLYAGNFYSPFIWIIFHFNQFLLSYILMFGICNIFYFLPHKAYLICSCVIFGIFSILGFVSRRIFIIRGTPVIPSDFSLLKDAIGVSADFKYIYLLVALIIIIIFILIYLTYRFTPSEKYKWPVKTTVLILSTTLLTVFYLNYFTIQSHLSIQAINWSQTMNYNENGMLLGFILDAELAISPEPSNYNEGAIDQIIKTSKATYQVDPEFKPNIIIVQSEAFWDPTLMENISFSQDPIPFFHSLQKSQTNGIMLSPVFGGGTVNTEFEALTGFTTQFFQNGAMAYSSDVNRPIEALPVILQRQGYASTAIHTYDAWFYGRNSVFKNFGFDKFISKEFFDSPEYSGIYNNGQYIRDTELTRKILDQVRETAKPDFIYAISMENHGPYFSSKNPNDKIKVSGSNLSPDSQAILENFTNSVSDVDQSLKLLINSLSQISEPTEVIFYGDHLPLLGDNYSVYKEAGFINRDESYQDYLKLHSVPFVTWNNFSTAKKNLRLSSDFIGTYALELAKKSGSPMTDFLSNLMKDQMDIVTNQQFQNQEKITPNELNEYNLLQYDLLKGKGYTYNLIPDNKPSQNSGYILGDGMVKIANVAATDGLLTIQGTYFVENDKVYIDGKVTETKFINSNTLTVNLPANYKSKTSVLNIQVKLTDSMKKVISASNVYQLSGN